MSQKGLVLRLLREAGSAGVSNHSFTYRFGITRAAAYVFELRQEGYDIDTVDEGQTPDGREKLARYVLKRNALSDPIHTPVRVPVDVPIELGEAVELRMPCGCVRSADGRSWVKRCDTHG